MKTKQNYEQHTGRPPIGTLTQDNGDGVLPREGGTQVSFWSIWCHQCGGFVGSIWLAYSDAARESQQHNRDLEHSSSPYEVIYGGPYSPPMGPIRAFWCVGCPTCRGFVGSVWTNHQDAARDALDHNLQREDHTAAPYEVCHH